MNYKKFILDSWAPINYLLLGILQAKNLIKAIKFDHRALDKAMNDVKVTILLTDQ